MRGAEKFKTGRIILHPFLYMKKRYCTYNPRMTKQIGGRPDLEVP